MEKKNRVISKRLQKRLKELVYDNQYDEAAKILEPLARKGHAEAQYKLGKLFYLKIIHTENLSQLEVIDYWTEKSKKQETNAEGRSDIEQMVYWYEKAAKQNHVKAMLELAEWNNPCNSSLEKKAIQKSSSSFLKCDLERALSLYAQAIEAGSDDILYYLSFANTIHSPHISTELKDKFVDLLKLLAKQGCHHAANMLLNIWKTKFRFPDRTPYYDLQIEEHELLHTDWFRFLLDHEIECEKKDEYSGSDAIRLLHELAEKGNQEALGMLTNIGLQVGGFVAYQAGSVHYERQEYDIALRCFQLCKESSMLGQMYERGEGTTPDAEKAFHCYEEAEYYANLGRMYEHGTGMEKDLQKAFDCYRKVIDRRIYKNDDEEVKKGILSVRRSFRSLKKVLFPHKDEIRMRVSIPAKETYCSFMVWSYDNCCLSIDWGDGCVETINNERGEELHPKHTYARQGKWTIHLKSDETHTVTAFHYTCDTATLEALETTQCPILTDLYCVNQSLKRLDVSQNLRLERLVCRGNQLRTLNIRKNNRLTQLDCSGNPLARLDWHPRFSPLARVCMKNTKNFNQCDALRHLLKINRGKECNIMSETPFEPILLPLSYYMRCTNWNETKTMMKEGGYPIVRKHSLAKYKSAFDDMRSRTDFCYTGIDRIVCDGGYTYYWSYSHRDKEYVHQDLEDILMNSIPWNETLDMPVEIRENEGWMMLPQATWADVYCACFSEMTYSHWQETEEIVQGEREFWKRIRQRQKNDTGL